MSQAPTVRIQAQQTTLAFLDTDVLQITKKRTGSDSVLQPMDTNRKRLDCIFAPIGEQHRLDERESRTAQSLFIPQVSQGFGCWFLHSTGTPAKICPGPATNYHWAKMH